MDSVYMNKPGGSDSSENAQKDHEMVYQQLCNLKANVCALLQQCECGVPQLTEAWVQSKITLADDYVDTVHDYVLNGGHKQAGQMGQDGVAFVVAVEKAMTSNGSRPA